MPSSNECGWQQNFRVSLSGGDTEILFEIFEEHAFGYNPQQLANIWGGRIPIQPYFGDIKQFDVYGSDAQKVGSLWVRIKTFSDGIKLSEQKPTETKVEEVIDVNGGSQILQSAGRQVTNQNTAEKQQATRLFTNNSVAASVTKSVTKAQAKANRNITSLSMQAPSIDSYQNRLEIYSMVASLKGLDVEGRDSMIVLELGEQTSHSSVTRNRGLEPVWIENITLGVNEEDYLQVRLILLNSNEEGEQIASGTLNLKEVRERRHIISKQVEMSTVEGRKKCGILYFDVRYRSRDDISSPLKNLRLPGFEASSMHQSLDADFIKKSRARSLHVAGTDTPPLTERLELSPSGRVKRSAVKGENGYIVFGKANRFQYWVNNRNPNISYLDPYAPNYNSFDYNDRKGHGKGPSIGYGGKYDFTKESRNNPGVGNYKIPSMWDKYDWTQQ